METWLTMAQESADAAERAAAGECWRSSISRSYYAAYQAMTAILLHVGLTPPIVDGRQRETWSHEQTPELVYAALGGVIRKQGRRKDLRKRLRELYNLRLAADYTTRELTGDHADRARRDSSFVRKIGRAIVR